MKNPYLNTLRFAAITIATFFLSSVTNAQVFSWSEDFSSEPADWVASGSSDNAGSGVSYDAANGRYNISAAGGGAGAPTFGLNGAGTANATGSPVDSYVAEITFDLINFKGGAGGADLTFTTTGTDGRMEVKLNPFGRFNLSHTDFANGSAWTINSNFGIVEAGGSILNNGDAFTIKMAYDGDADSMSFFYGVNGGADTLIYAATAANDSAGGYGFGDTITGTRWDANKKEAMNLKLYQWGGNGDPASIGLTSASVTLAAVPEPSVYALLAGCFALASVMIRRRR